MAKDEKKKAEEGYEVTDFRMNVVIGFLGVVAGVTFVAIILIIFTMRGLSSYGDWNAEPASPLNAADAQLPGDGEPRLQQNPVAERKKIVAEAEERLNSYALIVEPGVEDGLQQVHIPIDRAIALVGTGKVPYRQEPTVAALDDEATP